MVVLELSSALVLW